MTGRCDHIQCDGCLFVHHPETTRWVLRPGETQNKIYSRALLAAVDGFDYAVDDAAVSPGSSATPEATLVVNTADDNATSSPALIAGKDYSD